MLGGSVPWVNRLPFARWLMGWSYLARIDKARGVY